jgi:hypothetical protein
MLFGGVILNCAAVVALWPTASGIGVMLGNFAAVVLRRSAEERSEWTARGGALGCAIGFLVMVCALGIQTRL